MIDIYIKDKKLDLSENDLTITFTDFRFCDNGFSDPFSVDFDILKTKNNIEALGIMSPLYTGFDKNIKCDVFVNSKHFFANLYVNSVNDYNINITLYFVTISLTLDGKNLFRLIDDTSTTIIKWDRVNLDASFNSNLPKYGVSKDGSAGRFKPHPVMSYDEFIDALDFLGVTLDTATMDAEWAATSSPLNVSNLAVVCNKKNVCPQNNKQIIFATKQDGVRDFKIVGGQHISNNLETYSALEYTANGYEWQMNKGAQTIKFNRSCSLSASVEVDPYTRGRGDIYILKNNVVVKTLNITDDHNINAFSFVLSISKNDTISIKTPDQATSDDVYRLFAKFEISNYDISDDDYNVTLQYIPGKIEWAEYGVTTTYTHTDWAYSYFGIFCNLPDVSVKEYLTTIGWMYGYKPIDVNGNILRFVKYGNDFVEIEKDNVENIFLISDRIAKKNIISWRDGYGKTLFFANTENAEDEKDFFVSPFITAKKRLNTNIAKVDIYSVEDGDGYQQNKSVSYSDVGACLIIVEPNDTEYTSCTGRQCKNFETMGIENLNNVVEIEGWTKKDITTTSFLSVGGVAFLPVEIDYDSVTDRYYYKAIKK